MKECFINGRFLSKPITGVERYAYELVIALDKLLQSEKIDRNEYTLTILTPNVPSSGIKLKYIKIRQVGNFSGNLWEQIELPYYCKGQVLFNLCNAAPLFKKKQVVTIHDASVFANQDTYSLKFRIWYQFLLRSIVKWSAAVITDSLFSKDELMKYCGVPREKVHDISLGVDHILSFKSDHSILRKWNLVESRYILAVGSSSPNKNFESLVKAAKLLNLNDIPIVIAGGTNDKIFNNQKTDYAMSCIHVGYVTDGELRSLYEHALCFVFPSLYEGFGLPPLEAMMCGCPVITSNVSSLPEVCQNGVLYCDPNDLKDISEKISSVIKDDELRSNLVELGLIQSKQYTWELCGLKTFEILREVIN
ncbi:MAG: glycosyltransferase family 4 protein [Nitrospirae bacterium]|nr:glycosyltransferase family 4 protein [Nitrospirota bacterium]MBI3593470.1 glycosyltransferase family 4 protein [Nitrospirota bacterium]